MPPISAAEKQKLLLQQEIAKLSGESSVLWPLKQPSPHRFLSVVGVGIRYFTGRNSAESVLTTSQVPYRDTLPTLHPAITTITTHTPGGPSEARGAIVEVEAEEGADHMVST